VLCGDRSISLSRDEQRLITEHAEQHAWSDERLAETLQMSVPTVMRRRGRIRLTHRISAAR
jgi:ribosome-binding protein aMBF1 (putative translation factor)